MNCIVVMRTFAVGYFSCIDALADKGFADKLVVADIRSSWNSVVVGEGKVKSWFE